MNRQAISLILGFFLAGSGLYALVLMLVGIKISYLIWLDSWGLLPGFLARLLMIIAGFVIILIGTFNWERERAEIAEYKRIQEQSKRRVEEN